MAADVDDFNIDTENQSPFNIRITKIFRSNVTSRRISAQAGLFTIHYIKNDETIIDFQIHSRFRNKLSKLIIPCDKFSSIRKELNLLGVNHSTLFPDIDGLAKHLEWRFAKYSDEDTNYFC